MDSFWGRTRNLISLKGYKLYDVEVQLGLNQSFISQSTIRNTLPRADVALQIADFLGVTLRWLLTGSDETSLDPKYAAVINNKPIIELAFELGFCNDDTINIVKQLVKYDVKYTQNRSLL